MGELRLIFKTSNIAGRLKVAVSTLLLISYNLEMQILRHMIFCLIHIEGLTKGPSQKSGSPNETDLLNSYLVNLSHLVNQISVKFL